MIVSSFNQLTNVPLSVEEKNSENRLQAKLRNSHNANMEQRIT